MTLYTAQSREAAAVLLETGELWGRDATGEEWLGEAYAWMSARMRELLGDEGDADSDGMLWFWAKERRRDLVHLLKSESRGSVLLTVRIPRSRVLLSDFDDWHTVLNRGLHVPVHGAETVDEWWARADELDDAWRERVRHLPSNSLRDWPDDLRRELEASWLPIVDPGPGQDARHIQATTRFIRLDEVTRAVRLR